MSEVLIQNLFQDIPNLKVQQQVFRLLSFKSKCLGWKHSCSYFTFRSFLLRFGQISPRKRSTSNYAVVLLTSTFWFQISIQFLNRCIQILDFILFPNHHHKCTRLLKKLRKLELICWTKVLTICLFQRSYFLTF